MKGIVVMGNGNERIGWFRHWVSWRKGKTRCELRGARKVVAPGRWGDDVWVEEKKRKERAENYRSDECH